MLYLILLSLPCFISPISDRDVHYANYQRLATTYFRPEATETVIGMGKCLNEWLIFFSDFYYYRGISPTKGSTITLDPAKLEYFGDNTAMRSFFCREHTFRRPDEPQTYCHQSNAKVIISRENNRCLVNIFTLNSSAVTLLDFEDFTLIEPDRKLENWTWGVPISRRLPSTSEHDIMSFLYRIGDTIYVPEVTKSSESENHQNQMIAHADSRSENWALGYRFGVQIPSSSRRGVQVFYLFRNDSSKVVLPIEMDMSKCHEPQFDSATDRRRMCKVTIDWNNIEKKVITQELMFKVLEVNGDGQETGKSTISGTLLAAMILFFIVLVVFLWFFCCGRLDRKLRTVTGSPSKHDKQKVKQTTIEPTKTPLKSIDQKLTSQVDRKCKNITTSEKTVVTDKLSVSSMSKPAENKTISNK